MTVCSLLDAEEPAEHDMLITAGEAHKLIDISQIASTGDSAAAAGSMVS
jgi:hypothetical protein